jgi:hypothetical protein
VAESSYGQDDGDELRKLGELLENAESRRSFAKDPDKALDEAGIDASKIPEGVRSTLSELSEDELEVIARVKGSLLAAGVSRKHINEIF